MTLTKITKRSGKEVDFDRDRIEKAIQKACDAVEHEDQSFITKLTDEIIADIDTYMEEMGGDHVPGVELIQDYVEKHLMAADLYDVAKAYILYRDKQQQDRKRQLFKKRRSLKPYEYPELIEYVDSVRHSYWVHTEFNYTADIQDYKNNISESEREALKRAMLAIAQIEVSVKTFWADIFKMIPKPEVGAVGMTFAESEVRHADAYAHLLEILGLNDEFEKLEESDAMRDRIDYLDQIICLARSDDQEEYTKSIILFSLFIEHVSLFSQFLIMMSFNKHKNLFKGISNAVEATSKEEQIHGLFGIEIINIIREEKPEWFHENFEEHVKDISQSALAAEEKIVDWIYEKGELDFLPKNVVVEFLKHRFNNSLKAIGMKAQFETDEKLVEETEWFDEEVIATKHVDFFNKRSINYNKRKQSITTDDLF